eukprot:CAMPEP_0113467534 /NCGR_PEP_ID=MMETSP0014_2-20120614/14864_1 /TAXON_ID=2857 /ORGANISM="Nitzschia sp." /LENGTH=667 /DNA_ID=CAMNT_0000359845 /DNA_START=126 /DNA_END=2129 /DNA_ORIENTATION=- /assembly_acc=CAM_ASM_000159
MAQKLRSTAATGRPRGAAMRGSSTATTAANSNRYRRFHNGSSSNNNHNNNHRHHRRLRFWLYGFIVAVMVGIHTVDLARVHLKMRQLELLDFETTLSSLKSISVYSSSSSSSSRWVRNRRNDNDNDDAGSAGGGGGGDHDDGHGVTKMTILNLEYDPHWQYHHLLDGDDDGHGPSSSSSSNKKPSQQQQQQVNVSYNIVHDQLPFEISDISKTLCGGSKCLLGMSRDWHQRHKLSHEEGEEEEEVGFLVAKNHHDELDANATLHMERWYQTYKLANDIETEFVGSSTLLVGPPEIHDITLLRSNNDQNQNGNHTIFHDLEYFMVHNKSQSPLRIKGLGWVDDPDRAKAHLLGDDVAGAGAATDNNNNNNNNSTAGGGGNAFDDIADACICWCEPGHTCVLKAADGKSDCDTTLTKIARCDGKGLELIKPLLMQKVNVVPSPNLKVQYLMDDNIVLDIRYHLAFLEKIWPTGTSISASAGTTPLSLSSLPSDIATNRPPDMKTISSFLMNLRSGMRQLRSIFEKYRCLYHDTQWMVDYTGRVHHIDLDRCWTGGDVKSQYREGQDSKRYRRDKFLNTFQKCLSIAIMGRYNPDLEFYTYYNIDEDNSNHTILLRRPDQSNSTSAVDDRENWFVEDIPGLRARVDSGGLPDYSFLDGLNTSRAYDCYLI